MSKRYFHKTNETTYGPFLAKDLISRAKAGIIGQDDPIWEEGASKAYPARKVTGLFPKAVPSVQEGAGQLAPSPRSPSGEMSAESPQFRNPQSTLLNSLTTLVLDTLHAKVVAGELREEDFRRRATTVVADLQKAVWHLEAQTQSPPAVARLPQALPTSGGRRTGPPSMEKTLMSSGGPVQRTGKFSAGSEREISTGQQAAGAANPGIGSTALHMGVAALAGGAWGYLLGQRQHGATTVPAGGHVDWNEQSTVGEQPEGASVPVADFDAGGALSSEPNANVISADSDGDGLIDSFYGDTDGDHVADIATFDETGDGEIDRIAFDMDGNGSLDRAFTAEQEGIVDDGNRDTEDVSDFEDELASADDAVGYDEVGMEEADFGDYDDYGCDGFDFEC